MRAFDLINEAWSEGLRPPEVMGVAEWADRNRLLSTSSSPEPGHWRTDRTPYLRQIMECLSPFSPARSISFMKGSQVGATETGLNWVGYLIDKAPSSLLIVLPSQETAKEWSVQRLSQLTEDTECLHGKIIDQRRRDSGNTAFSKRFPGGFLKLAWSSSAKKLRSMPAGNVLADEVDGFKGDTEGEGDPVALLERRFTNFPRGKFFKISTPTLDATSRILREFKAGDQRHYFLPCPNCRHFQRLIFEHLRWEKGRPQTVGYECVACQQRILERAKTRMLAEGVWVATASLPELADSGFAESELKSLDPIFVAMAEQRVVSFHLSALYSPVGWYSWVAVASDWEAVENDNGRRKVFVNTVLGETWRERGDAPDWKKLFDRREDYALGTVPEGVRVLTAGADVQADRIEVQIVGWGRNKESWLVDYLVLYGDTARPEVWTGLTSVLGTVYEDASHREFTLRKLAIDSGFSKNQVYAWARQHKYSQIVQVIKGGPASMPYVVGPQSPVEITVNGTRLKSGIQMQLLNVSDLKKQFYGWLHQDLPNLEKGEAYSEGFFHFCATPDTEEYCKQLTAEQLMTRTHRGYQKREWEKIRPRNEALDTWLYAKAGALMIGLEKYTNTHWDRLEKALGLAKVEPVTSPETPVALMAPLATRKPKSRRWQVAGPPHQFGRPSW